MKLRFAALLLPALLLTTTSANAGLGPHVLSYCKKWSCSGRINIIKLQIGLRQHGEHVPRNGHFDQQTHKALQAVSEREGISDPDKITKTNLEKLLGPSAAQHFEFTKCYSDGVCTDEDLPW